MEDRVYSREHGVPHFHLIGSDYRCPIAIQTLEVLEGEPPRRALREALSWAASHHALLHSAWKVGRS